jgi:hypothetical protein
MGGGGEITQESKKKVSNSNSTHDRDSKTLDFNTQRVISTHTSVILTLMSMITTCSSVIYTRRVYFIQAECNFKTHKIGFYTQSVLHTHTRVSLTRMRVNMTVTSVISTRSSVIPTRRV